MNEMNEMNKMSERIFHFDIIGTITCLDTTEKGTDEELANLVLAKNIYGSVNHIEWEAMRNPFSGRGLSYYHYREYLSNSQISLKSNAFRFTSFGEPGSRFSGLVPILTASMKKIIFPSFLKVLEKYQSDRIVFRTFGGDGSHVIEALENLGYIPKFDVLRTVLEDYIPKDLLKIISDYTGRTYDSYSNLTGSQLNKIIESTKNNILHVDNSKQWKESTELEKSIQESKVFKQYFFVNTPNVQIEKCASGKLVRVFQINTILAATDPNYFLKLIEGR